MSFLAALGALGRGAAAEGAVAARGAGAIEGAVEEEGQLSKPQQSGSLNNNNNNGQKKEHPIETLNNEAAAESRIANFEVGRAN